jgi:type VI secretion system protein ImpA
MLIGACKAPVPRMVNERFLRAYLRPASQRGTTKIEGLPPLFAVVHCVTPRAARAPLPSPKTSARQDNEEAAVDHVPSTPVSEWLEPIAGDGDSPCGPDLEYDPAMQELQQLAAGKPETQFAPAEPPEWSAVRDKAAELLQRTRDLRVAMPWCRANVCLEGFAGVPSALCLLQGLLDRHWEHLHPLPDPEDGDTFARISALGGLDKPDGLLGDVRQALLAGDRRLGGLRVRGVEIALDRLAPRPDEDAMTRGQIEAALGDLPEVTERLRAQAAEAQHWLKRLASVMNDRFGIGEGVDLKQMRGMLSAVESVLPAPSAEGDAEVGDAASDETMEDTADASPAAAARARRGGQGVSAVESRADAVRAIELVCAYLERNEPSNPAQLLLRRAIRMIDKNFLQLVRDLAPDAVREVARIMGVNPDEIHED